MKIRFPKFLLVAMALIVFLLSSCAPATALAQGVVELPSPLQLAILAGVTFVVGYIFTEIAKALPFLAKFLGEYVDEVSTAVAGALILTIQNWLNAIPPQWEGVGNTFLAFLVAVLAAVSVLQQLRKARVALHMRLK